MRGKPKKPVQILQVGGANLRPGEAKVVDTSKITKQQRKWDGQLISIRDLKGGKSQVVYLG